MHVAFIESGDVMSLTLRDAQFLCWKTFKKIEAKTKKPQEIVNIASDLAKKANEISAYIKNLEAAGNGEKGKNEVARLLSELFFAAFILAEHQKVDLEESFMQTVDDYILGLVS